MKDLIREAVLDNRPFWLLTFASIVLIGASFVVPPLGVIDASVLAAVGELAGFGALWTVIFAIQAGVDAKVSHGNTSIEINNDSKEPENDQIESV